MTSVKISFPERQFDILVFLRWLMPSTVLSTAQIWQMTDIKFQSRREEFPLVSPFGTEKDGTRRQLGTLQIRQVSELAVVLISFLVADEEVHDMSHDIFIIHTSCITFINAGADAFVRLPVVTCSSHLESRSHGEDQIPLRRTSSVYL